MPDAALVHVEVALVQAARAAGQHRLHHDEHLERTLRRGLRRIQLQPDLIDGRLAGTRLTLTQQPTTVRVPNLNQISESVATCWALRVAATTRGTQPSSARPRRAVASQSNLRQLDRVTDRYAISMNRQAPRQAEA